ncbi:porin family protein [Frigoriflavimonas asaccharolytica]|uniref:Opacity protein-like surface antigen n=1 Tax=Frigoriflavimonas asaccharolytica TaxID=2735899 RepID=A0A8J8G503_9FLAO|nr:porin family protein [Frigoriflavimonas asaccharolytica]NRS91558.1 opacity protein-like surface antigen [Frigoriflavimonas asaccharolytica]
MKKLVLAVAVAASSLTFAQQFGIKGGMNVSSLSKDADLSDQKSKIGFNAGVFVNLPVSESFSIQPEVLYSQYGSKVDGTTVSTFGATTITEKNSFSQDLDYIAVPVMFQYKLIPSLYLEAGPEFGFLMSAKQKGDSSVTTTGGGNTNTISTNGTTDIKDNVNTFNFGVGIGAGYWITNNIGINARYVAGVTDVAKDRVSGDKVMNNVFQVGLGYKF